MPYISPLLTEKRRIGGERLHFKARHKLSFLTALSKENVSCDQKEQLQRSRQSVLFCREKGHPLSVLLCVASTSYNCERWEGSKKISTAVKQKIIRLYIGYSQKIDTPDTLKKQTALIGNKQLKFKNLFPIWDY